MFSRLHGCETEIFSLLLAWNLLTLSSCHYRLTLTAAIGITSGLIAALSITLVYIPSSIHTVLKFRSGVIPSLKDPQFINYRKNLHNQTYLIGSMFWVRFYLSFFVLMLMLTLASLGFNTFHGNGNVLDRRNHLPPCMANYTAYCCERCRTSPWYCDNSSCENHFLFLGNANRLRWLLSNQTNVCKCLLPCS